jgi:hypothetical protein
MLIETPTSAANKGAAATVSAAANRIRIIKNAPRLTEFICPTYFELLCSAMQSDVLLSAGGKSRFSHFVNSPDA